MSDMNVFLESVANFCKEINDNLDSYKDNQSSKVELELEKSILNNSNIALQKEIKRLEEESKQCKKDIEDYIKATDLLHLRIDITERKNDEISKKNRELINENANLIKSFNKSSIESDDRKVIELQSKVAQLQYQLTESLSNSMKWKNEVENKDWELKEIQHSLDLYKKSDKKLREQNIEVKEINNNLYCQLNDLKNKSNKSEECSKGIDEHLVKVEDDLSKALKEINQLKNIISHGTAENKSLIEKNGNLVDNSTRLFNENTELSKTLEEKKIHEQSLMSKCNEANNTVFNLKKINDLSNKEICDLKKAIEVLNERNNNQYDTIKKLERKIVYLESAKAYHVDNTKEEATNILYKKSNEIFGNKHIFEQTIEEMAELMVEINKARRINESFDLTKINNLPQIMEEVCDVQMCLNHLKILFNETDFKNIQVKKFNKFADHFKRQFNKKQNEDKLNDLINNPETKNHVFIPLDIEETDKLLNDLTNNKKGVKS